MVTSIQTTKLPEKCQRLARKTTQLKERQPISSAPTLPKVHFQSIAVNTKSIFLPLGSARQQQRKSKRIAEGRRFQTIGYDGEVRSPLRDKKNTIVATVQRSKSAQTPSNKMRQQQQSLQKQKQSAEKENDLIICENIVLPAK